MTVTEYICYSKYMHFTLFKYNVPNSLIELAHTKQSFKLHILDYDLTNCVFRYLKKTMNGCSQSVRGDFNVWKLLIPWIDQITKS